MATSRTTPRTSRASWPSWRRATTWCAAGASTARTRCPSGSRRCSRTGIISWATGVQPPRLRVFPQGHAGGGRAGHAAVRRDAPLHPRHRLLDGGQRRRDAGEPPSAHPGPEQIRPRTHGAGPAGPLHREVPPRLRHAPRPPVRPDGPGGRRHRVPDPRLPDLRQARPGRGHRRAAPPHARRAARCSPASCSSTSASWRRCWCGSTTRARASRPTWSGSFAPPAEGGEGGDEVRVLRR